MKTKLLVSLFILFNTYALQLISQTDIRLTNDPSSSLTSSKGNSWCIASDMNSVHVVWYDNRDGNDEIYYKNSSDGGFTWSADKRITNNSATSNYPAISVSGNNVHIVWEDNRSGKFDTYCKNSVDGGETWGEDIRLKIIGGAAINPSVATSGDMVHVVTNILPGIFYKRSIDGGNTWEESKIISVDSVFNVYPAIAVSGTSVYAAWYIVENSSNWKLYINKSTDDGATWGIAQQLTFSPAVSFAPTIAVSGADVHLAWSDQRDLNWEIYYKHSSDGGVTWSSDTRLTFQSAPSMIPSIAVSGSRVHLTWYDNRDGDREIYYKFSSNAGLSWGNDIRLTNSPGASLAPTIAVSDTVAHIVWYDSRDGNDEIYYRRVTPSSLIGVVNLGTEVPKNFSLQQNYPNPFNPSTKIRFSVPSAGIVILNVYNVLGQEAAVITNETLSTGNYEVEWNAVNFASGIYYYKLKAGNFVDFKKMILIK